MKKKIKKEKIGLLSFLFQIKYFIEMFKKFLVLKGLEDEFNEFMKENCDEEKIKEVLCNNNN